MHTTITYAIYRRGSFLSFSTNQFIVDSYFYQGKDLQVNSSLKMTIHRAASYFISTPIYYVNSKPHIGHLYSSLLADTIARWQSIKHRSPPKIIFSTGTDEHGLKIERAATAAQLSPLEFCNQVSGKKHPRIVPEKNLIFS